MTETANLTTTQLQDLFGPIGYGPNGFDYSWRRTRENKPWNEDVANEVRAAMAWLSLCGRTKTVNRRDSSYSLKHECEQWAGRYVSNGALLMAAHLLGFTIVQISYGPNGWMNISRVGRPSGVRGS